MGGLYGLHPLLVGHGPLGVLPVQTVVGIEVDQLDESGDGFLVHLDCHSVGTLGVKPDGLRRVFLGVVLQLLRGHDAHFDPPPSPSLTFPVAMSVSIACSTSSDGIFNTFEASVMSTFPLCIAAYCSTCSSDSWAGRGL